jgi:hypothetical protein
MHHSKCNPETTCKVKKQIMNLPAKSKGDAQFINPLADRSFRVIVEHWKTFRNILDNHFRW